MKPSRPVASDSAADRNTTSFSVTRDWLACLGSLPAFLACLTLGTLSLNTGSARTAILFGDAGRLAASLRIRETAEADGSETISCWTTRGSPDGERGSCRAAKG